jgi:carboxymethylenebutenolidase
MPSEMITLPVEGSPMLTYVAVPDGPGPFPGVVVAQAHAGLDPLVRESCDRIAQAGYAVAAPYLYHRLGDMCTFDELMTIQRSDSERFAAKVTPLRFMVKDNEIVLDMNTALQHLRSETLVGDNPIGVMGYCSGGRVAYLMATRSASIKAAACFYPTDLFESFGGGPSPFAASDRIGAHIGGYFGIGDDNPSPEHVARIDAELTRLGVDHLFRTYDNVEHGFMSPEGGRDRFRPDTSEDAWDLMMALFDQHLKAPMSAK